MHFSKKHRECHHPPPCAFNTMFFLIIPCWTTSYSTNTTQYIATQYYTLQYYTKHHSMFMFYFSTVIHDDTYTMFTFFVQTPWQSGPWRQSRVSAPSNSSIAVICALWTVCVCVSVSALLRPDKFTISFGLTSACGCFHSCFCCSMHGRRRGSKTNATHDVKYVKPTIRLLCLSVLCCVVLYCVVLYCVAFRCLNCVIWSHSG